MIDQQRWLPMFIPPNQSAIRQTPADQCKTVAQNTLSFVDETTVPPEILRAFEDGFVAWRASK